MNTMTKYQVRDNFGNVYGNYVLHVLAQEAITRYQDCPISSADGYKYEIVEIQTNPHRCKYGIALS